MIYYETSMLEFLSPKRMINSEQHVTIKTIKTDT